MQHIQCESPLDLLLCFDFYGHFLLQEINLLTLGYLNRRICGYRSRSWMRPYHGYFSSPTRESLKLAYKRNCASGENHNALGYFKISTEKKKLWNLSAVKYQDLNVHPKTSSASITWSQRFKMLFTIRKRQQNEFQIEESINVTPRSI